MYWQPGPTPGSVVASAPAKLNLTLEVGPPRQDGYHPIVSVMVPLSLTDELLLCERRDDEIVLEVTMADPLAAPLGADQDNLAWRAARLLQDFAWQALGVRKGVSIHLHKRIPVAAGLGGGSADAAAVLVGLNALWQLGLATGELSALGERLGADVPFCIRSKAGLVEGIGEQYTPLAVVPRIPVVLLNPRRPLSTAHVFRSFDAVGEPRSPGEHTAQMVRALFNGDLRNIAKAVYNDLGQPARHLIAEIGQMEAFLRTAGALAVQVTGSGPTVFGIMESGEHAREVFELCRSDARDWWAWWGWAGSVESLISETGSRELGAATCKG